MRPAEERRLSEELTRLIDEIRADRGWREEVARERAARSPAVAPTSTLEPGKAADGILQLDAPPPDAVLADLLGALGSAIGAADRPATVESRTPILGEAVARIRRQIHAELRIYQERQTAVNLQLQAVVMQLARGLDMADSLHPLGALWGELAALHARASRTGTEADARLSALERRVGALEDVIAELRGAVAALHQEVEPLGALRVTVESLEAEG